MAASRHHGYEKFAEFYWLTGTGRTRPTSAPNFVKIFYPLQICLGGYMTTHRVVGGPYYCAKFVVSIISVVICMQVVEIGLLSLTKPVSSC